MLKLLLRLLSIDWNNYRPAMCFPNHCFCEKISDGFIRQPIDAYSNVFYLLFGFFILLFLIKKFNGKISKLVRNKLHPSILFLYAFAVMAVGIGSFLYHSTFTFFGMELDDDTMYLVGSFILLHTLAKTRQLSTKTFLLSYVLLNLLLEVTIYFFPVIRGFLFAILILAALIEEFRLVKNGRIEKYIKYFYGGTAIFGLAYVIWIFDYQKIVCHPQSLFQGHAVWHILTACSSYLFFRFMETEYET